MDPHITEALARAVEDLVGDAQFLDYLDDGLAWPLSQPGFGRKWDLQFNPVVGGDPGGGHVPEADATEGSEKGRVVHPPQ